MRLLYIFLYFIFIFIFMIIHQIFQLGKKLGHLYKTYLFMMIVSTYLLHLIRIKIASQLISPFSWTAHFYQRIKKKCKISCKSSNHFHQGHNRFPGWEGFRDSSLAGLEGDSDSGIRDSGIPGFGFRDSRGIPDSRFRDLQKFRRNSEIPEIADLDKRALSL